MKKPGIALIVVGMVLILVSLFGDVLGLGRRGAVGAAQLFVLQIGAGLILVGIGIARIKSDRTFQIRAETQAALSWMGSRSPGFWIYVSFFLSYLVFFLFPVFLNSKLDIQYIDDFISDQGRIGFDIRSIVQRIEDWLVLGRSPYSDGFIGYPPLTILLFSSFILVGYPAYFKLITLLTILCYVISTLFIPWLVTGRKNVPILLLIFFTGLFSYGFQFELERGQFNVIAFTLCLLAIYLFHAHEKLEYWACLLFTLSVQMKVYPVFFILMFIRDWRDWKNNIKRLAGLAVINLSLLFVLGYQMFLDFVEVIFAYQFDYDSNRYENLSIKGFVRSLSGGDIESIPKNIQMFVQQYASLFEALFFILLGLSLLAIVARAYRDNSKGINPYLLVVCSIGCLIVPSVSNDYKLSILGAPLAIMLTSLSGENNLNGRIGFIPLIFIAAFAYWSMLYPFNLKPEILFRNFPGLILLMISLVSLYHLSPMNYTTPPTPAISE